MNRILLIVCWVALFVATVALFAGNPKFNVNQHIQIPCDTTKPQTVTVQLPQGKVGYSYTVVFEPSSGVAPFTFSWVNGSLPGGLDWNNGVISGVPNSRVSTSFVVECRDSA